MDRDACGFLLLTICCVCTVQSKEQQQRRQREDLSQVEKDWCVCVCSYKAKGSYFPRRVTNGTYYERISHLPATVFTFVWRHTHTHTTGGPRERERRPVLFPRVPPPPSRNRTDVHRPPVGVCVCAVIISHLGRLSISREMKGTCTLFTVGFTQVEDSGLLLESNDATQFHSFFFFSGREK